MHFPFLRALRAFLGAFTAPAAAAPAAAAPASSPTPEYSAPPAAASSPPAPAAPVLEDPADYVAWLDAGSPETLAWWLEQPPASREVLSRIGSEWRRAEYLILAETLSNPDAAHLSLWGEPRPGASRPDQAAAAAIAEDLARRLLENRGASAAPAAGRRSFAGHGARRAARAATAASQFSLGGIPGSPLEPEPQSSPEAAP